MKNKFFLYFICSFCIFSNLSFAESIIVPVHAASSSGVGEFIGQIKFSQNSSGLKIEPNLSHLKPGQHAMHIHENPNCDAGLKDGAATAALAAGPHFDPKHSNQHLGPNGGGHAGDLPFIEVDSAGEAKIAVMAAHLSLDQLHKHSIIIHENGDNYSDIPKPLGGAGARVACGIIP